MNYNGTVVKFQKMMPNIALPELASLDITYCQEVKPMAWGIGIL